MTQKTTKAERTHDYLWQIIRYKPVLFGGLLLTYVLQYCMSMIPVLLVRQILDSLTGEAQIQASLETLLLLWVVSELVRMGLFTLIILAETNHYQHVWSLVRANLFDYILSRPGAQALPGSTGEAISRFRDDVEQIQQFMSMLYNAVATGAFALIAFLVMATINLPMTVVVFLPMVLVTVIVNRARERVAVNREKTQAAVGQVTGMLGEIFGAVQAIQAAQAEDRVIERFTAQSQLRGRLVRRDTLFTEILLSITRNTTNFGTGVILLLGAESMRLGQFTVGDFILFIFYLGWVTDFTAFLGQTISAYRQLSVSFARLEDLVQTDPGLMVRHRPVYIHQPLPPLPQPAPPAEPFRLLEVKNLSYRYPGSDQGVQDISFRLEPGQIVAITGRIGAGKTTLLRALLGLLPDVSGTVCWNGVLVTNPAEFFIPPYTAYTPQVPHLFSDTVRENLSLGRSNLDLQPAIYAAALESDLATMEDGLDSRIGSRGMRLSGGQQLRLSAARMFARDPQVLIMDDLTSALDVDTERILWERLRASKRTCLLVSHRPAILHQADHVLWLENGTVLAAGKWRDISEQVTEPHAIY